MASWFPNLGIVIYLVASSEFAYLSSQVKEPEICLEDAPHLSNI